MNRVVVTIVSLCLCALVCAVPAYRGPMSYRQPDGSEIVLYQHGDESFHYFTNEVGQWMQADEQGHFRIVPSLTNEQIQMRRAASGYATRELRRVPTETTQTGVDRTLSPRGPIILVNFPDAQFSSTLDEMKDWAMGSNYDYQGATGSIHQYFQDVSYGRYNLQLDVFGPVTVDNKREYYGKDNGRVGADMRPYELVKDACTLAVAEGADFSKYDADNDGYVDWVVILYAGKGQADGGADYTIWPHQYDLHNTGSTFKIHGKTLDHYCMLCELNGQTGERGGIGVFVHEFSHVMGLPDLYVTSDDGHWKTLGMWDIMDYGPYNNDSKTPPAYSAYERWFMGWLSPTLINSAATIVLPDINKNGAAAYMTEQAVEIESGLRPRPECYILENRQQTGWDQYLPGHGLLITRILYSYNKWKGNTVNNTETTLGVDIIEADGSAPEYNKWNRDNGYFGKATDAYPAGSTTFTAFSNYEITDITEHSRRIYFKVNGGGDPIMIESIERVEQQKASTIKWLRNGQIVIRRGEELYDISGKRIQ